MPCCHPSRAARWTEGTDGERGSRMDIGIPFDELVLDPTSNDLSQVDLAADAVL